MGQRCNRIVHGSRGNNVTVILAISDRVSILYYEIHHIATTAELFHNFMTQLTAIFEEDNVILIMDNVRTHGVAREFASATMEVKYLPAYSPFLNPIEEAFSTFKAYLKHHLNDLVGQRLLATQLLLGVPARP